MLIGRILRNYRFNWIWWKDSETTSFKFAIWHSLECRLHRLLNNFKYINLVPFKQKINSLIIYKISKAIDFIINKHFACNYRFNSIIRNEYCRSIGHNYRKLEANSFCNGIMLDDSLRNVELAISTFLTAIYIKVYSWIAERGCRCQWYCRFYEYGRWVKKKHC